MKSIDDIRRENLRFLERKLGSLKGLADALDRSESQVSQWKVGAVNSGTGKQRGMRSDTARYIEGKTKMPEGWLDRDHSEAQQHEIQQAPAPYQMPDKSGDLVITQYDAGGSMGSNGRLLLEDQPGVIRSWNVSKDWLHLNVPSYTALKNLCIVTGFGPSMRPMFNPGDPLLVDRGVRTINHEGVYFFRVGEEGFIKIVQRVPEFDGPGFVYRIISKNSDYPPYDISTRNAHFEVIGKVLTVWCSEQF